MSPVKEVIDKIPPQNNEAELAVLGSMLLDKEAISRAIEFLDTVWDRQHKKHLFPILERTIQLSEAGRQLFKLPQLSTQEALREMLTGNDAWLATCAAFVVAEGKLGEYRDEVKALRDSSHEALRETAEAALKAIDTA